MSVAIKYCLKRMALDFNVCTFILFGNHLRASAQVRAARKLNYMTRTRARANARAIIFHVLFGSSRRANAANNDPHVVTEKSFIRPRDIV